MNHIRLLPLILLLPMVCCGAAESLYPLWDGSESVADYAKRVNMPPTKTLDLGNNVKLELVLIPAGKFVMGTPEPTPVDEDGFNKKIVIGQALLLAGVCVLLVLMGVAILQALRKRQRLKFSLLRLIAITVAARIVVIGGLHWQQSSKALKTAKTKYWSEKASYDATDHNEKPAHPVTLTKPFYIAKFVVTQEQYQQITGTNPSKFKGSKDGPVESISWNVAQEFCRNLEASAKQPVRLPTEAEWEYSARAGNNAVYYSDDVDTDLGRVAWYSANSQNSTHPVGLKEPNAFGLFDMQGNVFQWCADWYGDDYYRKADSENPPGPVGAAARLIRGGSYDDYPHACRTTSRFGDSPLNNSDRIGFRVALSVR